mmetsp:Transcript_27217/g.57003  ORF Transcript_27217/g.57003 Transcript_27217/m.57003 type:complete len:96 (-) Transcript_27217:467-754(-)
MDGRTIRVVSSRVEAMGAKAFGMAERNRQFVAQPPNQTTLAVHGTESSGGSIHEVGVSENENDRITNGRTDEIVVGYPRTATATESHVRSWHEHE